MAASSAAIDPPAPARFSMTTGCPSATFSFWPTMRAVISGPLPAAAVTIMRIGLAGYCAAVCAAAGSAMSKASNKKIGMCASGQIRSPMIPVNGLRCRTPIDSGGITAKNAGLAP